MRISKKTLKLAKTFTLTVKNNQKLDEWSQTTGLTRSAVLNIILNRVEKFSTEGRENSPPLI